MRDGCAHVRVGLAAALIALAYGCGGATQVSMAGGATGPRVDAPGPTATRYETGPSPAGVVVGDGAVEVTRGVEAAARQRGVALTGDGRLGLVASWVAERLDRRGEPPPLEVIDFFARHVGLVEPAPHLLVLGQPDRATLAASVENSVLQYLDRQRYTHFGGAVVERQGLTVVVLALSLRELELLPVPRQATAPAQFQVQGSVGEGLRAPAVVFAHPDGTSNRTELGTGPGFESPALVAAEPGEYRIEVLAQGTHGPTVLANFPVYVGVPIPTSIALASDDPATNRDAASVERELLRSLNATRRLAGRPPLELEPQLSAVARAHSEDMVAHGFLGHESPTTGSPVDRVGRAGYRSGLVLENLGRGYGAGEIHRGLLASPAHQANILNGDVTHVGVGVVAQRDGERTAWIATEVFVRMARVIDLTGAPDDVLAMLNRTRAARGHEPLVMDPNLAEAAQGAAARYFREPSLERQALIESATGGLRRFAIAFRRIGGGMLVASSLDEAAAFELALDPAIRYAGIGVAQGTRPDSGPNAISIVMLLGWPR